MKPLFSAHSLRLREKLIIQGANNLSDIELLAVFIGSGTSKNSCIQLAVHLIHHFGDLRALFNADFASFKIIPGLGSARYAQLQAGREMCRRSDFISLQKESSFTHVAQIHSYLKKQLRDKKNETFVGLFLDSQHRILSYEELFTGTVNTATIHPRLVLERALKLNAAALILAHNHPSGLSDASPQDRLVTKKLRNALELIDVQLLDHFIIGDNEVYSLMSNRKWQQF